MLPWATMLGLATLIAGACGNTDGAQSPTQTSELASSSTSPTPSSPSVTAEETSAPRVHRPLAPPQRSLAPLLWARAPTVRLAARSRHSVTGRQRTAPGCSTRMPRCGVETPRSLRIPSRQRLRRQVRRLGSSASAPTSGAQPWTHTATRSFATTMRGFSMRARLPATPGLTGSANGPSAWRATPRTNVGNCSIQPGDRLDRQRQRVDGVSAAETETVMSPGRRSFMVGRAPPSLAAD